MTMILYRINCNCLCKEARCPMANLAKQVESIEKNPDNLDELVDQFLWINTSLGNWSYVLRALELKLKFAGQGKREWNYEEMLNSLELVA